MQFDSIMIMKRLTAILFLLLMSLGAIAQLEVKPGSFKHVNGFVNINLDKMYDDNDKPYAVLKIKTENINDKQRRQLNFSGDARTFFEAEYKDGEVWLYISYYATYLKISHPDFSSVEFWFPFDMEGKKGYELTLVNKTNLPQTLSINSNWVVVKVTPKDAIVMIDGNYCDKGSAYLSLDAPHQLVVSHELYHTYETTFYASEKETLILDAQLEPAFGSLKISSQPESGATVIINGKRMGVTPLIIDTIASGQYEVTLLKDMYASTTATATVSDSKVSEMTISLNRSYAEITLSADPESDIYVDNQFKGKGTWKGRLAAGRHTAEARKASHVGSMMTIDVVAGINESFVIDKPQPIRGAINIASAPMGATVYIDGVNRGRTPILIKDVLEGQHVISIEEEGYDNYYDTIEVVKNQIIQITQPLAESYVYDATSNRFNYAGDGMYPMTMIDDKVYDEMRKHGLQTDKPVMNSVVGLGIFAPDFAGDVISENGLIITNCFRNRSLFKNYNYSHRRQQIYKDGFWAKSYSEEISIDMLHAFVLVKAVDITEEVLKDLPSYSWEKRKESIDERIITLKSLHKNNLSDDHTVWVERDCEYNKFYLYVYKKYDDVRLVGVPPQSIGDFGGEKDNWGWPRHSCNFILLRIYADRNGEPAKYSKDNVPLKTKTHFAISLEGVNPGDFTMIWGYPINSQRFMSSYEMDYLVNHNLAVDCNVKKTYYNVVNEFVKNGYNVPEQYLKTISDQYVTWTTTENRINYIHKTKLLERKIEQDTLLIRWSGRKSRDGFFKNLQKTYSKSSENYELQFYNNRLSNIYPFTDAGWLTYLVSDYYYKDIKEVVKIFEDGRTGTGYKTKDNDLNIDKKLLSAYLKLYLEHAGDSIPNEIRALLNRYNRNCDTIAGYIIDNSIFSNPQLWKKFQKRPKIKVLESDPAVIIDKALDKQSKDISDMKSKKQESHGVNDENKSKYVKCLLDYYQKTKPDKIILPDSDGSLRLTYGPVCGYVSDGKKYSHVSISDGLVKKYKAGDHNYDAPSRFIEMLNTKDFGRYADNKGQLVTSFLTKTDMVDGGLGSAVLNGKGELIGISADANWNGCIGLYEYQPETMRTINVDIRYILFIIDKYAGATNIMKELDIK